MHFLKKIATLGLFLSSFSLLNLDAMSSKKRKTEQQAIIVQGKKNKVSVKKNEVSFSFKQKKAKKNLYDFMLTDEQRLSMLNDFDKVIKQQKRKNVEKFNIIELCTDTFKSLKKLADVLYELAQELCTRSFESMEFPDLFIFVQKKMHDNAGCLAIQNEIIFGYETITLLLDLSGDKKQKFRSFIWTFCHELGHRYNYLHKTFLTEIYKDFKVSLGLKFNPFVSSKIVEGLHARLEEFLADECATRACFYLFEDFNPETDLFLERNAYVSYGDIIPCYQDVIDFPYKDEDDEKNPEQEKFKYEPLSQSLESICKHILQNPYDFFDSLAFVKSKIDKYCVVSKSRAELQEKIKDMNIKYYGYRYCDDDAADERAILNYGDSHPSDKQRIDHAKYVIEGLKAQKKLLKQKL